MNRKHPGMSLYQNQQTKRYNVAGGGADRGEALGLRGVGYFCLHWYIQNLRLCGIQTKYIQLFQQRCPG